VRQLRQGRPMIESTDYIRDLYSALTENKVVDVFYGLFAVSSVATARYFNVHNVLADLALFVTILIGLTKLFDWAAKWRVRRKTSPHP
jgi:hypothetical protein